MVRDEQELLLVDPWVFRDRLFSLPLPKGAQIQREALLHLVHPDTFEQIVAQTMKANIVEAFSDQVPDRSQNVDGQLLEIRGRLEGDYGKGFQFWEPELRKVWQPKRRRGV